MLDLARPSWLRLLRLPPEPALPAGDAVRLFRASPRYLHYRMAKWAAGQLLAGVGLFGVLAGVATASPLREVPWAGFLFDVANVFAVSLFLGGAVVSFALARLDFDLRWYVLSDRSLRIREGILKVKEQTMTFVNVQHVSIRQNPLQRLLGIADVRVRSAGGGKSDANGLEGAKSSHEAVFRGVDNAEEIRRVIRERARLEAPPRPDALEAARELLEEVRALNRPELA